MFLLACNINRKAERTGFQPFNGERGWNDQHEYRHICITGGDRARTSLDGVLVQGEIGSNTILVLTRKYNTSFPGIESRSHRARLVLT